MAILEDVLAEGLSPPGIAIGVGALLLAPVAFSVAGNVLKPLAKMAIKGGLIAYDQGRGYIAEFRETMSDLVEESKSELSQEHGQVAVRTQSIPVRDRDRPSTSVRREQAQTQTNEPQLETEGGAV